MIIFFSPWQVDKLNILVCRNNPSKTIPQLAALAYIKGDIIKLCIKDKERWENGEKRKMVD